MFIPEAITVAWRMGSTDWLNARKDPTLNLKDQSCLTMKTENREEVTSIVEN